MTIGFWLFGCVLLGMLLGLFDMPTWARVVLGMAAGFVWTQFCISFGGLAT